MDSRVNDVFHIAQRGRQRQRRVVFQTTQLGFLSNAVSHAGTPAARLSITMTLTHGRILRVNARQPARGDSGRLRARQSSRAARDVAAASRPGLDDVIKVRSHDLFGSFHNLICHNVSNGLIIGG